MSNKINGKWVVEHDTTCGCGHDLTQAGAIDVHFSDGNQETNQVDSQVDSSGVLEDLTGQIGIGQHAGSYCAECGELLDEC